MTSGRKIVGRRAVLEALHSKETKVEKLVIAKGLHGSIIQEIINEAEARKISIEWMDKRRLDKLYNQALNQGVIAFLKAYNFVDIHELISRAWSQSDRPLLVIADEIEDPRNLGAICRSAEGAGAHGVIITYHRSAEITPVTEKASGGSIEHLAISQVKNLAQVIELLKKKKFWIAGLDANTDHDMWTADLDRPLALIIGSEGKGLRRLTKTSCDFLIKIPMQGKIGSLNAAVAAGIALFEIKRQQYQGKPEPGK